VFDWGKYKPLMNYIGSKQKLLPFITDSIQETVGSFQNKTFAEVFGGTGVVSRYFKNKVKSLIANDLESYSYVLLKNYLGNTSGFAYASLIEELNEIPLRKGFIFKNYCLGGTSERQYFSDENGQKIDTLRLKIEQWKSQKYINKNQYYFLLASLLESADKVANTASVYGAFLKQLKKTAQRPLVLEPALFKSSKSSVQVFNQNANELIKKIKGDILYLDPPYNARQYGANYHLLNTIALYDKFIPKGKTGLRHYSKSSYCQKRNVAEVFEELIKCANFEYIFLSYNNEGLLSEKQIIQLMRKYGEYSQNTRVYTRFKADKNTNRKFKSKITTEFLHILRKEK